MNKDWGELIEWLDSIRPGKAQIYDSASHYNYQYEMNINRTQHLLRVGLESVDYRDMWEELYRGHGYDFTRGVRIGIIMDYIKRKYFPKPKLKDTADRFILDKIEEAIKDFLQDIYHIKAEKEIKERNKKGGLSC